MTRPQIDVGALEGVDQLNAAYAALVQANDPPTLFQRATRLVRLYRDEDTVRAVDHGEASLKLELTKAADFGRGTQNGWTPLLPSRDVTKMLLAMGEYSGVPALDRVVSAPVLGPDGRQLRDGYNHASRTFLARSTSLLGTSGGLPVKRALALIDELLVDFPLEGPADRANVIAMMLTPLVRDLVFGPTPLFLIAAPKEGVGKTLLALAALYPIAGAVEPLSTGRDDDEVAKVITAVLRQGPSAVLLDNVKGFLDSPSLARALTAEVWQARVLRESTVVKLPVRNTWVMTANNPRMSAELKRRIVPIHLVVPEANRTFKHADLMRWVERNRARLFSALVSLVEHWQEEFNSETSPGVALPSYEAWAGVVGSILAAADVEGFLGNLAALVEVDQEDDELGNLLSEWHNSFGGDWMPSFEIVQRALLMPGLAAALPTTRNAYALGKYLQMWKDRPVDGLVLRREGRRWRVECPKCRAVPGKCTPASTAISPGQSG